MPCHSVHCPQLDTVNISLKLPFSLTEAKREFRERVKVVRTHPRAILDVVKLRVQWEFWLPAKPVLCTYSKLFFNVGQLLRKLGNLCIAHTQP